MYCTVLLYVCTYLYTVLCLWYCIYLLYIPLGLIHTSNSIMPFFLLSAPYGASTTVGRLPAGARGLVMDPHGTVKSNRSANQMRQKVRLRNII